jgi:hypothetical protein
MSEQRDAEIRRQDPVAEARRLPWKKPTLRRVNAASAELGPRAAIADGGFTNS